MVAHNTRCKVYKVPPTRHTVRRNAVDSAQELLPWADPYIAGLLGSLCQERAAYDLRAGEFETTAEQIDDPDEDLEAPYRNYDWPLLEEE